MLAELIEEEMNYDESKKEEIDKNKVNKKEIKTLQQSLEQTKESCNLEGKTVDALEKFLHKWTKIMSRQRKNRRS